MKKLIFIYILLLFTSYIIAQDNGSNIFELMKLSWNNKDDNSIKTSMNSDGNYGLSSYEILNENEVAFLCNVESVIKIYDFNTNNKIKEIQIKHPFRDFTYDSINKLFYLNAPYNIYVYDINGNFIKQFEHNDKFNFIIELKVHNQNLYVLTSDGNSYQVTNGTNPISKEQQYKNKVKGWLLSNGDFGFLEISGKNSFEFTLINSITKAQNKYSLNVNDKVASISFIGNHNDLYYILLDYIPNNSSIKYAQKIIVYSTTDNKIKEVIEIPNIYYFTLRYPIKISNGNLYYFLTGPQNGVLFNLGSTSGQKMNISFPSKYNKKYHINNFLPPSKEEPQGQINNNNKDFNCTTNDPTMGFTIINLVEKYRRIEWNATASNFVNNTTATQNINTDNGGGYMVRVPDWISTTSINQGLPYKWGGWTHYNNWLSLVNQGMVTGDISTDSPYEVGDNNVIGVDCSGLVSRAWDLSTKHSTNTLVVSTLSTPYANISDAERGDGLKKTGHIRLVVTYNLAGSFDVVEAVTASYPSWSPSTLVYGNKVKFENYLTS